MATTLAQLVSKLRSELKIDPNDKIWSTDAKEEYVNSAYLQVQRDGQFNWRENQVEDDTTIQMVAGTEKYNLPSDFVRLDYIQTRDNLFVLRASTLSKIRTRGNTGNSAPNEYFIYGNQIGFYPKPDKSYTTLILYRKRLATLTDSQDSELPSDFDQAIIKYAAYLAWSSPRGNPQVAGQKLEDYKASMSRLRLTYLLQNSADLKFSYQVEALNNRSDKALYD
jgi:hypothetical protein